MFATGNSQLAFVDALVVRHRRCPGPTSWSSTWTSTWASGPTIRPASGAGSTSGSRCPSDPGPPTTSTGWPRPASECARYAQLLRHYPLDLCCLGIGENGHLAFNDPPVADFDDPLDLKVVTLDGACRRQQVNEGHFPTEADVPDQAITVTIPALLRARQVLAVVPEARKAEPVKLALEGPVSTTCPASILQRTAHATVFLDPDSAAFLSVTGRPGTGSATGREHRGLPLRPPPASDRGTDRRASRATGVRRRRRRGRDDRRRPLGRRGGATGPARPRPRPGGRAGRRARFDQGRSGGDQGGQVHVLHPSEHPEQHLGAAHVPGHLVRLGPRREVAAHDGGCHPGVGAARKRVMVPP